MRIIGLLSDTHGYFDPVVKEFFASCEEIWHAGDIGNIQVAEEISSFKPLRAVYGNIDGADIRLMYPLDNRFNCEDVDVWITHIGGYPGNYFPRVREEIRKNPPLLFITGHSHICKIMHDKKNNLLHINPGAAGKVGFHDIRTAIRFKIEGNIIKDLELFEIGKR